MLQLQLLLEQWLGNGFLWSTTGNSFWTNAFYNVYKYIIVIKTQVNIYRVIYRCKKSSVSDTIRDIIKNIYLYVNKFFSYFFEED